MYRKWPEVNNYFVNDKINGQFQYLILSKELEIFVLNILLKTLLK